MLLLFSDVTKHPVVLPWTLVNNTQTTTWVPVNNAQGPQG